MGPRKRHMGLLEMAEAVENYAGGKACVEIHGKLDEFQRGIARTSIITHFPGEPAKALQHVHIVRQEGFGCCQHPEGKPALAQAFEKAGGAEGDVLAAERRKRGSFGIETGGLALLTRLLEDGCGKHENVGIGPVGRQHPLADGKRQRSIAGPER